MEEDPLSKFFYGKKESPPTRAPPIMMSSVSNYEKEKNVKTRKNTNIFVRKEPPPIPFFDNGASRTTSRNGKVQHG